MRATVLGTTAFVLATLAGACGGDEPTSPLVPTTSVELCQRPQTIDPELRGGERVADKTLALTFDDGPAEVTSELSTYLRSQGIAATFFVNGANFPGLESVLPQLVADGHLIGNHTQTHAALSTLSASAIVKEVEETDALIAELVPPGKLFFRPPYGDWNADVQKAFAGSAMNKYAGPVGWDIGDHLGPDGAADWDCWSTDDGTTRSVAECGALYLKEIRTKKKGVVLMHDGPPMGEGRKTLEMVKAIVPTLKSEGYRFARIDAPEANVAAASDDPCAKR